MDFPKEEEKILEFWRSNKIFENCLQQSKHKPTFTFYDGPPFATGLPHYGHILTGTVKDIITRFAHQQGYHVERRFGWDCHGLPVEYEIDQKLNIRSPDDVARIGLAAYNEACRGIVMKYASDWKHVVQRMGRWIDFENDYKTMYPWYMESIWWIFQQLYNKGLVYLGVKVMPFSIGCGTPLSNFEAGQNYKDVIDPAIVVSFPVDSKENVELLAWTTTPWTLPANLALCVHPDLDYVKIRKVDTERTYVLAAGRLSFIFPNANDYEIVDTVKGSTLCGIKYKAPFDYYAGYAEHRPSAFHVLCDNYVSDSTGTGIVHQAPYFGEVDYRICLANGVIDRDSEPICPVDASGRFTSTVTDFHKQYVKDADKAIIRHLKAKGLLIQLAQIRHSYPYCWRSDTPLIYKAVPSWFVRVEQMAGRLIEVTANTHWIPEAIKEKRFGNWLSHARDWAISRNRYWGTPIPIWSNVDGSETVCIGSIAELQKYTDEPITDLHRDAIDAITIPSMYKGQPPLRRIAEVFDCWFESGAMPYAQQHYPFENETEFGRKFPADFIAEGIDQTRGWFYTLLVISTALFDRPPFRHLIACGLVLAEDGQKMSKRKRNYPDPMEIVGRYGADAVRLYLIDSPVVRGENLLFKQSGVQNIVRSVLLPWYNACRFFQQNSEHYANDIGKKFEFQGDLCADNVMDIWIRSTKESLLKTVTQEMSEYRLYTVVPALTNFIEQLTNWYVRLNRRRFKGDLGAIEQNQALNTMYDVLTSMCQIMAPFTPFMAEYVYQLLRKYRSDNSTSNADSIHYSLLEPPNHQMINENIERSVKRMQTIIELGRIVRERNSMPLKQPITEVIIITENQEYLDDIQSLNEFILTELNTRQISLCSDRGQYNVSVQLRLDYQKVGNRLKEKLPKIEMYLQNLSENDVRQCFGDGGITIYDHQINVADLKIVYSLDRHGGDKYKFESTGDVLILADLSQSKSMKEEGLAREIINRVQKLKKKTHLMQSDQVVIFYHSIDDELNGVLNELKLLIESGVRSAFLLGHTTDNQVLARDVFCLKGSSEINISIVKVEHQDVSENEWLQVELDDKALPRYGDSRIGMIRSTQSMDQLRNEVQMLFGLYGINFVLKCSDRNIKVAV